MTTTITAVAICTKCKAFKPRAEFFLCIQRMQGRHAGMYSGACKACYTTSYERRKVRDPIKYLFDRVKYRARAEGIRFTITVADIYIPEFCPLLGIHLDPPGLAQTAASPTLDRVDSGKGYIPGNVAVISRKANAMKGDGTAEQHERIAAWMRSKGVK